ncbi:MAG: phenylalanine--tRNA ligase subunit beta [Oscillospiraceae bacterium]|nr:phenylalanine--tRNA ligase subunit beta [Oscillospiraceae bacterium]
MKLSLNWIKDYVKLPEKFNLKKLAYDLTMSTVEVEGMVDLKHDFENMVIGVVKEILPHPNADKLVLCHTDVGDGDIKEIVCGGSNLYKNMKVAVARPGSFVRWHGEGELVELKKTKVRGIESYGMICASSEIGLFDLFPFEDEHEIVDLTAFDAPAGTELAVALGLDDIVLEIDNKSLTNRPDLWGHYGIAREISAIYGFPLREIPPYSPPEEAKVSSDFEIIIDDSELCPRYIGARIEGVSAIAAPFEIQSRIWRVGMRPIGAIVDITNYVMLATGQPTHAFDANVVEGNIVIRRAKDKEKLLLLNGMDLSLTSEDLVIADRKEAIALAGVMGGEKDSILPDTKDIILEIANFNALSVRRTSMRHEVRTEAATRFEKAIDPQRIDLALSMSLKLFGDIFPNMTVTGFHDNYPKPLERKQIDVSLYWLCRRLGKFIENDELAGKLASLGFDVSFSGDNMHLEVPTWRSTGDISIPDDITEEIARIHGLENFEPAPIAAEFSGAINQTFINVDRNIREYLAFRCGMNEVYTYPWVNDELINAVLGDSGAMIELSAPPSPEEKFLRSSLLPNLCNAVSGNLRYFSEFSIFESAQVFFDDGFSSPYDEKESLPRQRRHVAAAFVAPREDFERIYRQAKGVIESMARFVHLKPLTLVQDRRPYWADEIVWQNIMLDDEKVGDMAILSQTAARGCGIKNASVMLFEIDIDALVPLSSRTNKFEKITEYPMTEYDVSLLFDTGTKWDEILKAAEGKPGPDNLLKNVSFFEQYKGKQIPAGKKSITLRLLIGSTKKTLTSDEIENCANAVVKRLTKVLGAEARKSV